jgi:drug/metabolite transporter (DMT)-like permease
MNGVVAAVYASFFLAISQAALKKSYRELEPSVSFFFDALLSLVIWIPIAVFFGAQISELPQNLIYAIISAILSEALVFYALSKGQLSVTAIIIASYPIYTIIFSYFINGETLNQIQLIFVSITIAGTLLSSLPSKLSKKELWKSGAILWPIIAAFAIGFSDALSKKVIDQTSSFSFLAALALVQIPVALIYLKIEKQKIRKIVKSVRKNVGEFKYPLLGSIFNVIGVALLWLSFENTMASIASPITATSGAILILLTILFMDEKIKLKNLIGITLVFIGIFGISSI